MKFSLIIATTVGAAALLLLSFNGPSNLIASNRSPDARAQRELADSLEATREQVNALTVKISKNQYNLQRRIEAMEEIVKRMSGSQSGETDSDTSEDESLSLEERLTRRAEAEHRQRAEEVARLEKEETDYTWSALAEERLNQNFEADEKYDLRDIEIKCRTTHCSVRGEFGNSKVREQKINWLMTLVPWNANGFYHGDDIEGETGTVYVMRGETP